MSTVTQFQELKRKMNEAKKAMQQTAKDAFKEMSAEVFESTPELVSFGWRQYTPYFNDGDVCTFRCHSDYPEVTVKKEGKLLTYDSNYGEGDEGLESYVDKVKGFLHNFDDEDFEQMFGDHVTVNISRDGVEIFEYEHD